ncbi:FAD binding domain protein [Cladochytrium replicatum]|nr:FAD binding domain protein [Cladochytrium replicatum]
MILSLIFVWLSAFLLAQVSRAAPGPVCIPRPSPNCITSDPALIWLGSKLSPSAAIACRGSPLQLHNYGRYWGTQFGKNASVVVYPTTKEDVSFAVQAARNASAGNDFAFVCGAHSMTGASSATGFIIDLSWMNGTKIEHDVKLDDVVVKAAIAYQGGALWSQVDGATSGSGYTAVGARVSDVGVGGFSTGGGIGFLAGAYGYAGDRLRAMEIVLMSGEIVLATKTNKYADLFWAIQGGGGQFGIVTKFYQEAAAEPTTVQFHLWFIGEDSIEQAQENTVKFFNEHNDPFSLMYYALSFLPAQLTEGTIGLHNILVAAYFNNPLNPASQKDFNTTYADLISGLNITYQKHIEVPYSFATQVIDTFFPHGFRRGFYGPQTTTVTVDYLQAIKKTFDHYINTIVSRGDLPASALWALQYMSPGLSGNLPKSDTETSWPHSVSAHQTLFSPAWLNSENDKLVVEDNDMFNKITWDHQDKLGKFIADYPNYISPGVSGSRVWGSNVAKLVDLKGTYDPECRIHSGRVFASKACIAGGWANIYA